MQSNQREPGWCHGAKRAFFLLALGATLLAGHLSAGTISFELTNQGGNVFNYQFLPGNLDLLQNQEIDIRFDPALFGGLSNGKAGSDFRLSLLQPNNPVGAFGDYSALALVGNPSFAGTFSVDVTWLGKGSPGALPYLIHQFDSGGQRIIGTLGAGTLAAPAQAPEPAGWLLSGLGFAIVGLLRAVRPRCERAGSR